MDSIAALLDRKLRQWQPETCEEVKQRVSEIIDLADQGVLDLMRSRAVEQDVLNLLDDAETR